MITDETKPEDFKNNRGTGDYSHIIGWGIDADTENDPTYPMKNRTNEEHRGKTWPRPATQHATVEVLKSVERPDLTAAFGTSTPPSGLSGMIRRMAFKYSESDMRRWVPLMLADRINMIEGMVDDFAHGKVPNIPAERGWGAEWKHNRTNFIAKIAVTAIVTAGIISIVSQNRKKKKIKKLRYQY